MKRPGIIIIIFILLFSGCKQTENKKQIMPLVEKQEKNLLNINLEIESENDMLVRCFFGKIEIDNSKQEGSYYINQKLSKEKLTNMDFKMFGDFIPIIIQLRMGTEPVKAKINKIIITYNQKEIIVNGEDLDRYFAVNKYVAFNKEDKTIITKKIDGRLAPNLTLKRGFINKLFDLN